VQSVTHSLPDWRSAALTSQSLLTSAPAILGILCALIVLTHTASASTNVVRGADEIFWVPTLEQALEMSQATGKPLFLMGYSLVGDGSTYTKVADDYCTGVF
jgi:hypothetical protein